MMTTGVHVSAVTGHGLQALHDRLRALASGSGDDGSDGEFSARARHWEALRRALEHAESALEHVRHEQAGTVGRGIALAHDALGEITGRISADDMLGHIFSTFCIGK